MKVSSLASRSYIDSTTAVRVTGTLSASYPSASLAAGSNFAVAIAARDSWSNVIAYTADVEAFSVSSQSAGSQVACVYPTGSSYNNVVAPCAAVAFSSSAYVITVNANNASASTLVTAYLNGVLLAGSSGVRGSLSGSFLFAVNATSLNLANCYLMDNGVGAYGLYSSVTGFTGSFYAFPVDTYGNPIRASATTCSAALTSTAGATAAVSCAATASSSPYYPYRYRSLRVGLSHITVVIASPLMAGKRTLITLFATPCPPIHHCSFTVTYTAYAPGAYTQTVREGKICEAWDLFTQTGERQLGGAIWRRMGIGRQAFLFFLRLQILTARASQTI